MGQGRIPQLVLYQQCLSPMTAALHFPAPSAPSLALALSALCEKHGTPKTRGKKKKKKKAPPHDGVLSTDT